MQQQPLAVQNSSKNKLPLHSTKTGRQALERRQKNRRGMRTNEEKKRFFSSFSSSVLPLPACVCVCVTQQTSLFRRFSIFSEFVASDQNMVAYSLVSFCFDCLSSLVQITKSMMKNHSLVAGNFAFFLDCHFLTLIGKK